VGIFRNYDFENSNLLKCRYGVVLHHRGSRLDLSLFAVSLVNLVGWVLYIEGEGPLRGI